MKNGSCTVDEKPYYTVGVTLLRVFSPALLVILSSTILFNDILAFLLLDSGALLFRNRLALLIRD